MDDDCSSANVGTIAATRPDMSDVKVVGARRQRLLRRASTRCKTSTSTFPTASVTAFIGPSGCGKSTFLRCINRMNDTIPIVPRHRQDRDRRPGHLRSAARRGAAARPRRHGVPEAQSVPEVDLRERRLRPAHPRPGQAARPSWTRSSIDSLQQAGLLEEVKDRLHGSGNRPVRRPAAAPVHRARHRGQPRRHPDGRAVLGARSDRHRQDRGADRRAARTNFTHHHRHAFDAAGRARVAAHGVLPPRQAGRGGRDRARSSPTPHDKRTQDYITGRFG